MQKWHKTAYFQIFQKNLLIFGPLSGADLDLEKGVVYICFIEGKATELTEIRAFLSLRLHTFTYLEVRSNQTILFGA